MSLFDVIKYPLSDPPTLEELNALPDKILNQWVPPGMFSVPVNRIAVYRVLQMYYFHDNIKLREITYRVHINNLKRTIEEYDESA